jgi:glutamate-5-semialdehyde dehydrogenase
MTDSEIHTAILDMGRKARAAARELVKLSSSQKNTYLIAMAERARGSVIGEAIFET